jgi:hypothetical protein
VDNLLPEYDVAQCINQKLQLHTAHANPLRQTGLVKNRLLAVKGQVVSKLCGHEVSQ